MARSRYKVTEETHPHFLTFTVNEWIPVFTRPDTVSILYDTWKYLQVYRDFHLYGYVVLENHVHIIAQSDNLSRDIKSFKAHTARSIIDYLQQQNVRFLLNKRSVFRYRLSPWKQLIIKLSHKANQQLSRYNCILSSPNSI